ncbi:MAG TPA: hypothetical protein VE030_05890 [Burkholderiales bacterium]|nr:hypothetical protein [Burkholderiales bacterium]
MKAVFFDPRRIDALALEDAFEGLPLGRRFGGGRGYKKLLQ